MATKKKRAKRTSKAPRKRAVVSYRLTDDQKKHAKAMAKKGATIRAIADKLGCAPSTAWRVTRAS